MSPPMVCSVGSVNMAVMAKLSVSGKSSHSLTEKAGHQKLVSQYIQKELLEADDANLLDEEDMHIFDLHPLTDPLHLVCCNFCRKPVKASQFVVHAELCKSLGIAEELLSELDSGTSNWKPPRKERKKSVTAGKRVTSTGGHERFATVDASETASQLDGRNGIASSCLVEANGTTGMIAGSAGEMISLTKPPKLIAAETAQPSDALETARGVSNITSFQDPVAYCPAPLAAKTYYSQRNSRLQAAISHMYNQASINECCINKSEWQGNLVISESSSIGVCVDGQFVNHLDKSCAHSSTITQNANQMFRQGSDVSLVKAGDQTSTNFVNQFSMADAYTSHAAAAGAMTTRYHPKSYPFAGDSGTSLATIQRPTGSIHVA